MKNFKILNKKENPLFKRKEVEFSIEADVTPSRVDTKKFISEKFSAPIDAIKIKNILGKFGSKSFTIRTNIYSSIEYKESIEPRKKKGGKPEEKPEEKKEEKPEGEIKEEKDKEKDSSKSQDSADQQGSELKSNKGSEPQGETNKEVKE